MLALQKEGIRQCQNSIDGGPVSVDSTPSENKSTILNYYITGAFFGLIFFSLKYPRSSVGTNIGNSLFCPELELTRDNYVSYPWCSIALSLGRSKSSSSSSSGEREKE